MNSLWLLSRETALCYADGGEVLLQLLGGFDSRVCLSEEIHVGDCYVDESEKMV